METYFVDLAPTESVECTALSQTEEYIKQVAIDYLAASVHANELLPKVANELLAGTPGTIKLKRYGHRPLSQEDVEQIINVHGSEVDKKAIADLGDAQRALTERLKETSRVGLVIEQAGIPYTKYYLRVQKPELWKADQMIAIIEVLERLKL